MNLKSAYVIPTLAVLLMASAALAQPAGPGGREPDRTPPTAEQMAARRTQMCADMQARAIGRLAYMQARLNLTPAQQPLFQAWKASLESRATARQADCTKPRPANTARPTLPERNARMEEALKTRLAALEKMRPAQEALYNALSPEQKQLFERRGQRGRGMAMRGFNRRRFARGGFRRGFGAGPGTPG